MNHEEFDNKTLDQIIDLAWGYIVVAIGKGNARDTLSIIIQKAMSYGADKQKERDNNVSVSKHF
jgi:hypothetical protein